jgi:hypothetical protein
MTINERFSHEVIVTGCPFAGERGTPQSAPLATEELFGRLRNPGRSAQWACAPAPWLWPGESEEPEEPDDAGVVEALDPESEEVEELELVADDEAESPEVDGVVELVVPRLSFL